MQAGLLMFSVFFPLQNHYLKDVPFHNCTHAADVTQTSHTLLSAQAFEVSVACAVCCFREAYKRFMKTMDRAIVFSVSISFSIFPLPPTPRGNILKT